MNRDWRERLGLDRTDAQRLDWLIWHRELMADPGCKYWWGVYQRIVGRP